MKQQICRLFFLASVLVIGLSNGGGGTVLAAVSAKHAVKLVQRQNKDACGQVAAGRARCLAKVSTQSIKPSAAASPAAGSGYGPAEFHTAYHLPCTPGGPVASVCSTPGSYGPQTIAIVDAGSYSSGAGTLESAMQTYDNFYGLPACTAANGCLNIVNQSGATSPLPGNVSSGWSTEIALDVESAHMICQTCKIVLVEADDDFTNSLAAAEVTAASFNPVSISNSWGSNSDQTAYDSDFKRTGMAVVASTGDNGTVGTGQSWPADIPEVVSAAGTTLQINTDNTWAGETAWSGTGGGCSLTYAVPSYQSSRADWAANGCDSNRAFGDVSADGDPGSGAAIVVGSSWFIVGGTSLSSPLIAAMYALGDDLPAGTSAASLPYQNARASVLHDIVSGNDCSFGGQQHCTASAGFDTPTGLGSPRGVSAFQSHVPEDINQDSHINLLDFSLLAGKYSQSGNSLGRADINQDGTVNLLDFSLLANKYGSQ